MRFKVGDKNVNTDAHAFMASATYDVDAAVDDYMPWNMTPEQELAWFEKRKLLKRDLIKELKESGKVEFL